MIDDVIPAPRADPGQMEFHVALSKQRNVLVRHAYELAGDFGVRSPDEQRESVPQLSALLAAALEELRIAEEELRVQNDELLRTRDDVEQQLAHYTELFELAPTALLVTDSYGMVTEANRTVSLLTGRDRSKIIRKPIAALIALEQRRAFRDGLSRLALTGGTDDWRFVIDKLGVPVEVSAIVRVLDRTVGRGAFYWSLHPVGRGALSVER